MLYITAQIYQRRITVNNACPEVRLASPPNEMPESFKKMSFPSIPGIIKSNMIIKEASVTPFPMPRKSPPV